MEQTISCVSFLQIKQQNPMKTLLKNACFTLLKTEQSMIIQMMKVQMCESFKNTQLGLDTHMTLCSYSKKQYPAHRVSLGGCSPVALQRYLIDHPEIEYVNLGLDNDEQGRNAAENIKEMLKDSYKVYDHTPTFGKDFNEDLMHRQEQYRESHKEKDDPEPER